MANHHPSHGKTKLHPAFHQMKGRPLDSEGGRESARADHARDCMAIVREGHARACMESVMEAHVRADMGSVKEGHALACTGCAKERGIAVHTQSRQDFYELR